MARQVFTAVLHKEEDLYVAECPEVGTVSQGYTVEEAVANLREATELYLAEFPLPDSYALERPGFVQARRRGSHAVLRKHTPEGDVGCVAPLHRELALGALRGILRQARVTPDEFVANL